jgi:predicted amidohydrolase
VYKDRATNIKRLAALITTAANAGAKLIVCPELATSGYSMMSVAEAEPLAEVLTNPSTTRADCSMGVISALAKKFQTYIVWGLVEKDFGTGKLYNSQVMVCPDTSFESFRKINLWGQDFCWASEGRANPPIRNIAADGKILPPPYIHSVFLKVGLLICRDVRDKKDDKWKSFYEKGDADVVCLSCAWGKGGFPATAWMEFAKENNTTLIVSNRYGTESNNDFGSGGVCIIYPDGTVNCEGLIWDKDCIVFGEV